MNVSKTLNKGNLKTQIGTPYYMSPEIWQNRPYDSSSDMWSLGCMMYELCALQPPFQGDSFPQLKRNILAGRYSPLPGKYSSAMTRAIANMLRLNPQSRLTAADMLRSPEVAPKLHLDGIDDELDPIVISHRENFPHLLQTIKVPQNLKKLGNALPKPCYPDTRPNTPTAWPVSDQAKVIAQEKHRERERERDREREREPVVDDLNSDAGSVDRESHPAEDKRRAKGVERPNRYIQKPPGAVEEDCAAPPPPRHHVKLTKQPSAPCTRQAPAPPDTNAPAPGNRGRPVPGQFKGKPSKLW
jgi:serine/threonine protein kinase